MATARQTTDHDEIREWVERNGGRPAQVEGTGGMLRVDFGERDERLEPIDWDQFFDLFDRSGLGFLYDPEGRMNKFIQVAQDRTGIGKTAPDERGTRRGAARGRKKTSATRKKTSTAKKSSSRKTSSSSKKTTSRKSAGARKSTGTRKKASGHKTSSGAKDGAAKKTTRKGASTRKKTSGRKYSPEAGRKVERSMHEMKEGKLRSGSSGKKVKNPKQAVAIGLSEARRSGAKVPPPSARGKSSGSRKKR